MKLIEAGRRNDMLWRYISGNTRVPGLVLRDLEARIASAELGVRRFCELWTPMAASWWNRPAGS